MGTTAVVRTGTMTFICLTLWLVCHIARTLAASRAENCAAACFNALSPLKFNDIDTGAAYYSGLCNSTLLVDSTYACFATYCSQYSAANSFGVVDNDCTDYGYVTLPKFADTISSIELSAVPTVQVLEEVDTINNTVLPDRDYFDTAFRTLITWDYEVHMHHVYGWCMYVLAAIVLFIGAANRLLAMIFHKRFVPRSVHDIEEKSNGRSKTGIVDRINNLVQKHLILPATFGYRHIQPLGWCTIPTRIESVLLFVYITLNVIFSCLDYRIFIGNTYFPKTSYQVARYVADRTGIMSFANLPLMFLFAGRNNLLLWITGWSFASFNMFHRWVARVATVQAIVHSIAYTYCYWLDTSNWSEYKTAWTEQFFYTGVIATIAMSFILCASALPIRRKAYEFFLAFHVSFSIIVLVTLFFHVKIYLGEYDPYLWVCVGFWAFDRLIRLVRMLLLNYRLFFSAGKANRAVATYDPASDIIRLRVRPSTKFMVGPGVHYYVYTPTLSFKFWENHPFTLASWTNSTHDDHGTPESPAAPPFSEAITEEKTATVSTTSRDSNTSASNGSQELLFIVRPYKGMTKDLKNRIVKSPPGTSVSVPVFIEGPYGVPLSLDSHERILLISGGSGITATLPYLKKYGSSKYHFVRFVCTVREHALLTGLARKELAPFINRHNIRMDLHLTRESKSSGEGFLPGRPDVAGILEEECSQLEVNSEGRLAVFVCGPARLADDVRREVVRMVGTRINASKISLYEEAFVW